jgi:hypothetical protein
MILSTRHEFCMREGLMEALRMNTQQEGRDGVMQWVSGGRGTNLRPPWKFTLVPVWEHRPTCHPLATVSAYWQARCHLTVLLLNSSAALKSGLEAIVSEQIQAII